MAKKDILKFQKALLSKTNVMKEEHKKENKTSKKPASTQQNEENTYIDKHLLKKYEVLSKKHHIELNKLINFGIQFFLEFEDELFKK